MNSNKCVFLSFCVFDNVLNLEFFCSWFLLVQRVPCTFPAGNRTWFNNGNSGCKQNSLFYGETDNNEKTVYNLKVEKTCRDKSCLFPQSWCKHNYTLETYFIKAKRRHFKLLILASIEKDHSV